MPAYFQRPENALKRANGEEGIGTRWTGAARGLGGRGGPGLVRGLGCFHVLAIINSAAMNIGKFTIHILLKPGLENFEDYFTSI